jgi:hypothetical protein
MPAPRPCRYTAGQSVEVDAIDFRTPGMPHFWAPGVVEWVEPMTGPTAEAKGLWNVHVKRTDQENCWSPQIVGPRGGNNRIRPAAKS